MDIPEINVVEEYHFIYENIASIYSFPSNSRLQILVETKAGHIFPRRLIRFSLYRLWAALFYIIETCQFFDPNNPKIIWCKNTELQDIFEVDGFHFTNLCDRLKNLIVCAEECISCGWTFVYPPSVSDRMKRSIEFLENKIQPWGGRHTFASLTLETERRFDMSKAVVQISARLEYFLFSNEYTGNKNCAFCIMYFVTQYVKHSLISVPYNRYNIIYIACPKISDLFGNVKAFTKGQLPRFIKHHLTSGSEPEPKTCHITCKLSDKLFNLTCDLTSCNLDE